MNDALLFSSGLRVHLEFISQFFYLLSQCVNKDDSFRELLIGFGKVFLRSMKLSFPAEVSVPSCQGGYKKYVFEGIGLDLSHFCFRIEFQ